MEKPAHSPYGGSSIRRVKHCPGSVSLIASLPPRKGSSSYAEEGTHMHTFAEHLLREGDRSTRDYIGATFDRVNEKGEQEHFVVTEEMADAVQVYLDWIYSYIDEDPDSIIMIEQPFEIETPAAPGMTYGKNDVSIYQPKFKRLIVGDFKSGAGISVHAEDNDQLKFYMTGAVFANMDWAIDEIILAIVQPRAWDIGTEGAIRDAKADVTEVLDFAIEINNIIIASQQPDAPLNPGDWCQFCAAAPECPMAEATALEKAQLNFASVVEVLTPGREAALLPPDQMIGYKEVGPNKFDPVPHLDRINGVLNAAVIFEAWFSQVRKYAEELLRQGHVLKDWKLVEKQSRRKVIVPQEQVFEYLSLMYGFDEDKVLPRKLATLTEIDKMIASVVKDKTALKEAKDEFSVLHTAKESSGLTLVHSSDKRPAINLVDVSFKDVVAVPAD